MKKMNSKELRQLWLDFFKSKGHEVVPSKSLIPFKDPSLLWINSGVATLKGEFSGKKIPSNPRITNSQKSIRTNDIENVGITSRHHTLFEMLGNFSIGDYFKKEAIEYSYEFIFKVLEMNKDNIYITYFDEDKETLNKWRELGIADDHIIKGSKKTNFWDIGQGPCGPCTEIFYDRGSKYDPENVGIKLLQEDLENDRYIEIWNIVFSEFNNDGENNYTELLQKNIDTGAGLERIVSILQDVPTNFDTDLFQTIVREIEKISSKKYEINNYFTNNNEQTIVNKHFKIIADHIRAVVMAIQDGAKPSNTSRGYIIRRLIRRAYRSMQQLCLKEKAVLYKLVPSVKRAFGVYEIDVAKIQEIIRKEELAFSKTIAQGEALLKKSIQNVKELDAKVAFKLFETFGFPIELTLETLKEKNISFNMDHFNKLVEKHAEKSRGKKVKGMAAQIQVIQAINENKSVFIGYDELSSTSNLLFEGEENGTFYYLFDKTPFYATSGGQLHDFGSINYVEVLDVFKDKYGNHWHVTNDKITGDVYNLKVNVEKRLNIERNHTATHILGRAIKDVLGQSTQLGSDNNHKKLRLDFPADSRPTNEQIISIENKVKDYINTKVDRIYHITDKDGALSMGAVMLEEDNYGDIIRVVDLPGISKEFCGGTHISNVKDIETFKIISLDSKGSGTFRIEAITSNKTVDLYVKKQILKYTEELKQIIIKNKKIDSNYSMKVPRDLNLIKKMIDNAKNDNKKLSKTTKKIEIDFENIKFEKINNIKTYHSKHESSSTIKTKAIQLREHFPDSLIVLESIVEQKKIIVVTSKNINCMKYFKKHYPNAKGGGGPEFAMGSSVDL